MVTVTSDSGNHNTANIGRNEPADRPPRPRAQARAETPERRAARPTPLPAPDIN